MFFLSHLVEIVRVRRTSAHIHYVNRRGFVTHSAADLDKIADLSGRLSYLNRLWLIAIWLCGSVALGHAAGTTPQPSLTGHWVTANRAAVIQIAPCGADLCGWIVGIKLAHPGDSMPTDWRGRPQCGMTILQTAPVKNQNTGDTQWVGSVLDPRNGDVYHATMALNANHDLRLHGYIGLPIFGQTQIWTPFSGRILGGCKLAGNSTASAD